MSDKEEKKVDAKGIPLKSPYPEQLTVPALYSLLFIIISFIGVVIAYFTSYFTKAKKNAADAKISILSEYDLGWLYLGIFVVKSLQLPININLGSPAIPQRLTFLINRCIKLWDLAGVVTN
ncbi:MAG: hypothetical protein ACI8RD_013938 [Bacillariaceae sp.]|jgi:hypothetical protein